MLITQVHKNHVRMEVGDKVLDYFLLQTSAGWYCIQTNNRYPHDHYLSLALNSAVLGAAKFFAEDLGEQLNIEGNTGPLVFNPPKPDYIKTLGGKL